MHSKNEKVKMEQYSLESFQKKLLDDDIRKVYHLFIIGNYVWYFYDYLKAKDPAVVYDQFKSYISDKFSVSFNNICIVGSAKLGFSISPKPNKMFNKYRENPTGDLNASDIDLIIVSKKHYDEFRNAYIRKYYNRDYIHFYIKECVFRKFINFKNFTEKDEEYNNWLQKTKNYQKELQENFDIRHNVNYLVFESWEAADMYYINNLNIIKDSLREKN